MTFSQIVQPFCKQIQMHVTTHHGKLCWTIFIIYFSYSALAIRNYVLHAQMQGRKKGAGSLNKDRENVGRLWGKCREKSTYSPHINNILSTSYPQNPHPTIYQLLNNFSTTFSPNIINASTNCLPPPHFKINILSIDPHYGVLWVGC